MRGHVIVIVNPFEFAWSSGMANDFAYISSGAQHGNSPLLRIQSVTVLMQSDKVSVDLLQALKTAVEPIPIEVPDKRHLLVVPYRSHKSASKLVEGGV